MGFNENLKLLLLEKNMKLADLCRMAGIQTSLMSEYINGRKSPTTGNAILIADVLNISWIIWQAESGIPAAIIKSLVRIPVNIRVNTQMN